MLALYVLFGIGLFVIVVGGTAAYFFFQSEQGQQVLKIAKQGAEWVTAAAQAPGTEELRDAGCDAAMVSSASAAVDIFMAVIPEQAKQDELRAQLETAAGQTSLDELQLVICTLPRLSLNPPGCDEVARIYGDAIPTAPNSFYVLVIQQGQESPSCQGIYDPSGTLLLQPELEHLLGE